MERSVTRDLAERRMFSKKIIDTDAFLDMSVSARLLYYDLAMRADDDGFVSSPKKISKMVGCSENELTELASNQFIIIFESGVCAIKDWSVHNYIQKDRYRPTQYELEKSLLNEEKIGLDTNCIQTVSKLYPQDRLGKDRLGKDRLNNIPPTPHGGASETSAQDGESLAFETDAGTKTHSETRKPCKSEGENKISAPSGENLVIETVTSSPCPSKTRKPCKSKAVLNTDQQAKFDLFWAQYPNKKSKKQAETTFAKLNPDGQLLAEILAGLERSKEKDHRFRDNGRYIPHPSTWLNSEGWLDEFSKEAQNGSGISNNDQRQQNNNIGRNTNSTETNSRVIRC